MVQVVRSPLYEAVGVPMEGSMSANLPDFDEAVRIVKQQFPDVSAEELARKVADLLIGLEGERKAPESAGGARRKKLG